MSLLFKAKGRFFLCLVICYCFISACKEPDNIGLEILPDSDLSSIGFSDTASLQTSVVKEDSVPATGNSSNLLGYINDNIFGATNASFYSQVLLSTTNVTFGSSNCDSIILTLAYSGYYGDTASTHNFEVYRLNETIADSIIYYSNKTFNISDQLGTLITSDIRPTDSVGSLTPHLRIPLNNSFGTELISAPTSVYESISAFRDFFKGIYVKDNPSSATGSILYFALKDTMSKITLYYNDSLSYSFPLSGSNKINHFEHDYSTAVFTNNFNDPEFGKNLCYVQSMAGIKTRVDFPYLNNFIQNGDIAVNKAELVITIDNSTTGTFSAHNDLFLVGIDSTGTSFFLPDYITSLTSFGGTQSSGTYTFLVTRYIQQILTGARNDHGLYIVASGASVNANRTVVGGGNNATFRMKLKLNSTSINP